MENVADVCGQENMEQLKDDVDDVFKDVRFTKQHTEKWHELRNVFLVTGRKLFSALGLDTLKQQIQNKNM